MNFKKIISVVFVIIVICFSSMSVFAQENIAAAVTRLEKRAEFAIENQNTNQLVDILCEINEMYKGHMTVGIYQKLYTLRWKVIGAFSQEMLLESMEIATTRGDFNHWKVAYELTYELEPSSFSLKKFTNDLIKSNYLLSSYIKYGESATNDDQKIEWFKNLIYVERDFPGYKSVCVAKNRSNYYGCDTEIYVFKNDAENSKLYEKVIKMKMDFSNQKFKECEQNQTVACWVEFAKNDLHSTEYQFIHPQEEIRRLASTKEDFELIRRNAFDIMYVDSVNMSVGADVSAARELNLWAEDNLKRF